TTSVGHSSAIAGEALARSDADTKAKLENGLISKIPVGRVLLAITNSGRIIVYSVNWRRFKLYYFAEYQQSDLRTIEITNRWGLIWRAMRLKFSDGSSRVFDVPRLHDYEEFKQIVEHANK